MQGLEQIDGFDWDDGNIEKNWIKHGVSASECEELFFNLPVVLATDDKHSITETRYYALGKADAGRLLFAAFTVRHNKVRIISARDMSEKERKAYGEADSKV